MEFGSNVTVFALAKTVG